MMTKVHVLARPNGAFIRVGRASMAASIFLSLWLLAGQLVSVQAQLGGVSLSVEYKGNRRIEMRGSHNNPDFDYFHWNVGERTFTGRGGTVSHTFQSCKPRIVTLLGVNKEHKVFGSHEVHVFPCQGPEEFLPESPADVTQIMQGDGDGQGQSVTNSPDPDSPIVVYADSESPAFHARRVSDAGIGVQSIIDEGYLDAVDLWGQQGMDAEVCIKGVGAPLLLDAAFSPRAPVWLKGVIRDGMTCVTLDRTGTLVLMRDGPTMPDKKTTTTVSEAADPLLIPDPVESSVSLAGCRVRLRHPLNFRASPAGEKAGLVQEGRVLEASERTSNWFQVTQDGKSGWISAHLVHTEGDCGQARPAEGS